jgi:FHA domain
VSSTLIQLLTLCLLALVYLFFLRVLRAVWVEVQPPRTGRRRARQRSRSSSGARPAPGQLAVVLPAERQGYSYPLADEVTVGRAAGCAICVDDTYASQLHARIYRREGQVMVEDLGSTNGTYLNRQRVAGPTPVRAGDHLQVGSTVFEVRP